MKILAYLFVWCGLTAALYGFFLVGAVLFGIGALFAYANDL